MSDTSISRILWSCVKDGPQEQTSDIPWLISLLVHWRIWAWLFIWMVPLYVGLFTLQHMDSGIAVLFTWCAAALIAPYALKASPKYEVSENY